MSSNGISAGLSALQPLGRALMLPIAVLPVAGLLLRLGQPDMLHIAFVAGAGDAIFHNLGLIFAIGVAVGFARDGNGAAALAGAVCFLVAGEGAKALLVAPPDVAAGSAASPTTIARPTSWSKRPQILAAPHELPCCGSISRTTRSSGPICRSACSPPIPVRAATPNII